MSIVTGDEGTGIGIMVKLSINITGASSRIRKKRGVLVLSFYSSL